jgi:hypothetical protein
MSLWLCAPSTAVPPSPIVHSRIAPVSALLSGPSPAWAPPGPALSPQLGADPPARARVTRAASARGGPATWSSSAAGTALPALPDPPRPGLAAASSRTPRPRAPRRLWLYSGAEREGRVARRTVARSRVRTQITDEGRCVAGLGRGAFGVVSP